MTESEINLTPFLDKEFFGGTPWNFKGFRYATDGRIAVRVPTDEPDSDDLSKQPANGDVTSAFPPIGDLLGQWSDATPIMRECCCIECEGEREVGGDKCPGCDGDGEVRCPTCWRNHDCDECGGHGKINRKRCPRCQGKMVGAFEQAVAYRFQTGHAIAAKYYESIARLPNARYGKKSLLDMPLRFTFDGGDGVVMRRKDP